VAKLLLPMHNIFSTGIHCGIKIKVGWVCNVKILVISC